MARITVEDCIDKFPSRFELVLVASNRARKIHAGEDPTVEIDNDKYTVVALREIAEETLSAEQLKTDLIEEYQTNTFAEDEDLYENQDEDSSDEAQSEITEFENDQTTHNQESITQTTELKPIDTSKDNLENSSDEDKI